MDSDSEMDTDSELELDEDIEDLLSTANQHNVIVTTLPDARTIIKYYEEFLSWIPYYGEDLGFREEQPKGPECSLCRKEAISDEQPLEYAGDFFTVLLTVEAQEIQEYGFLRCVYCFNTFHRHGCTLSISDTAYYKYKSDKTFACPLCVPEFQPKKVHVLVNDKKCFDINYMLLLFDAFFHMNCFNRNSSPTLSKLGLQICLQDINQYCKTILLYIDKG
ncbi:unnamed protein product [Orchesella dallaii]|uniref:Uncharacterized protein n=1 Tax=Orchesella dallaii TaxID=48710 RepID=A0ABP1S7B7_9HEXA